MEESFRARVDKVFGSLASVRSSSSSLQSSPWSITGDEVERKEWRRCADTSGRDEMPCSSSFDAFLKKDRGASRRRNFEDDREGIDDADEEGDEKSDEEEDEFDKVASGREGVGDRLYMRDVTETGSYLNSDNVLGIKKDPRANHLAAKLRLKEDEAETESKTPSSSLASSVDIKVSVSDPNAKCTKIEAMPNSILKRKEHEEALKSPKRVRFDVGFENECKEESFPKNAAVSNNNNNNKSCGGVPDYLVNPSKYRCYSFASTSEVNDNEVESLNRESGSDMESAGGVADLPNSVTFIPKKKKTSGDSRDIEIDNNEVKHKEGDKQIEFPVGIAIAEVQSVNSGVEDDDDDDETEIKAADEGIAIQNAGRRYRKMSRSDD
ncbi:hypothetical protein CsatA_012394 [Cannabis sativa]